MKIKAFGKSTEISKLTSSEDFFQISVDLALLAVADGLVCHACKNSASQLAIKTLFEFVHKTMNTGSSDYPLNILETSIKTVNKVLLNHEKKPGCNGFSTSLTSCLIEKDTAYFSHIGNTRAYLVRNDDITQLTIDHSPDDPILQNNSENSELDKQKKSDRIMHSLGISQKVVSDAFYHPLYHDDLIFLCTDGVTSVLNDDDILSVSHLSLSLEDRCLQLLALVDERGSTDQASVILASCQE